MATTITTQSTTIKRIVHDPSRNRVLLISASGVDIYRVTDWTRIAWAAIANATCGAFNDGGIYVGTSTTGVYRLPHAATGAATSQLVSVFATGTAVALSSYDIKSIAGFGSALAIVTASEFVYLPNPSTSYDGPVTATAVAMNGTYLAWATSSSVEILNTLPTADFSSSSVSIGDTANHLAFEVGTNNLLICHEDGLRLIDCADPGGAGGMPTDGLVAHWTMDSIDGTTLIDEEGTQNGTTSGTTQVEGHLGKALTFGGDGDKVTIAKNSAFDFGSAQDFSYAVWFKTSASVRNDILENGNQIGKWSTLYINNGIFAGAVDDGANAVWVSGSTNAWTVNDDAWHLGVVTFDRSGNAQRYIDSEAYGDPYSISSVGDITHATDGITLGTRHDHTDYFNGEMDGLRIYNRALTPEEIAILFLEGIGGYGTNYDSDLGTVTDCQDAIKRGDYLAYGTSNDADGGRFGILELDEDGAATSKTTVASTDTDAVWLAAGATEAIYNNQHERYRLIAEMSPGAGGRSVRRDWALYAEITDSLGGIQSGTVALKVNGVSKTPTTAAITDGYSVSYAPGSNSGYGERVTIEISGTDADGNTVGRAWTFTTASAPALTVTDSSPPNVTCIRDIDLATAESDETVDSVNVVWIDTITSPLIVTEAQAKEVGRVAIDGQTYHRHKVGVKVLATDSAALQTRDLRQGGVATITCDALGMSAQKCEILAAQRVIDDGAEDISFNLQAAYYEAVS